MGSEIARFSLLILLLGCSATQPRSSILGVTEPWKEFHLDVAGQSRTYELVWPNNPSKPIPVLFFLHGLDSTLPSPERTAQDYRYLSERANATGFLAVFPRGARGSYPQLPDSLGWFGDAKKEAENRQFLLALLSDLSTRYAIDKNRVVLGGYANGGYLVARELIEHPDSPFTGFWVENGGVLGTQQPLDRARKPPVYISLATDDWLHFKNATELVARLIANGWNVGRTLKVNKHTGDYSIDKDGFAGAWSFLVGRNS